MMILMHGLTLIMYLPDKSIYILRHTKKRGYVSVISYQATKDYEGKTLNEVMHDWLINVLSPRISFFAP
jgi:hypothetical protein